MNFIAILVDHNDVSLKIVLGPFYGRLGRVAWLILMIECSNNVLGNPRMNPKLILIGNTKHELLKLFQNLLEKTLGPKIRPCKIVCIDLTIIYITIAISCLPTFADYVIIY